MAAKEFLEEVLENFKGGRNWVKGHYYRKATPNKEEFCLMGGIYKTGNPDYKGETWGSSKSDNEQSQAIVALANEIRRSRKRPATLDPRNKYDVDTAHHEIIEYNDANRTTWKGVEGKLKKAIKRLS